MADILFFCLLPIVAFLYASVGHGGASGYLALMGLFSFAPEVMKPTALLLNLFVAAISFYHYWRMGHFHWKLFVVFALASVPLSFVGGMIEIDAKIYKIILGVLLLLAIIKMIDLIGSKSVVNKETRWDVGLITGGAIGFFSGLIGIGGGIILSPVILLLRWGNVKEAAAVSALFIWVNSASGFIGQWTQGVQLGTMSWLMVGLAVFGGFFGGYFGSKHFNLKVLRYMLAFVLLLASFKLMLL
jgi:uncharacterized membrane protein YfcA